MLMQTNYKKILIVNFILYFVVIYIILNLRYIVIYEQSVAKKIMNFLQANACNSIATV